MCPLWASDTPISNRGNIDESLWVEVRKLAQRIKCINICGFGEPFCNPKFVGYLQELDRLGISFGFSTNGLALTKTIVKDLATLKNVASINVSIDSPDPEIYKKIRGGKLDQALKGLEILIRNIPYPERVTVSSVAMRSNLYSLIQFPQILSALGVTKYVLQGMHEWDPDFKSENLIDDKILRKIVDEIKLKCDEFDILLDIGALFAIRFSDSDETSWKRNNGFSKNKRKQCLVPWEIPFINKNGCVFPCCYAIDDTYLMGRLEEQDFEDIWNGKRFEDFRDGIIGGIETPLICRKCNVAEAEGPHPKLYSAEILFESSRSSIDLKSLISSRFTTDQNFKLVVKNTGKTTWTKGTYLRIGTSDKRDRESVYYHPSWINQNRICTFIEESVPPGGIATFEFTATPNSQPEVFQLLVEGVCWLPGKTKFKIKGSSWNIFRNRLGQ